MAELGYDARWYGLRAADVGAAHGRFRVFLFATPANSGGLGGFEAVERDGRGSTRGHGSGVPDESDRDALRAGPDRVPGQLTLLPTPAVNDMGAAYTPETWDAWTARMKDAHGNGNGHGKSLNIEELRMLPTPEASRAGGTMEAHLERKRLADGGVRTAVTNLDVLAAGAQAQDWREYEAAIRRQETAFGRPAPLPTEPGAKGQPRLSPRFVEWLMALPDGWVTDIPGISRNDMLKALGNGVCPPQCAAALRAFLTDTAKERAA